MKKSITILLSVLGLMTWSSCEENNVFDDLGAAQGSTLADVYFEPFAPKLQAGVEVEKFVQFWSVDDYFEYTGLWEYVYLFQDMTVEVEGVIYESSTSDEFADWTEVQAYPFDYADFNPEEKAYVKTITYQVDNAYDLVSLDKDDLTVTEFIEQTPEEYQEDVFSFYSEELGKDALQNIIVGNGLMTQSEFDALYDENGNLTDAGQAEVIASFEQLGLASLIGDSYTVENEYQITLGYRVTNGSQKFNDARRSFLVF
ncbi:MULTISPECIES: hypothetical protein [Reichenbachiella]|uniref:Lipoprotein n=1 Tax=Reichenbachiella agariperforans TaxID=156994 RepID=A0A1M6Q3P8_REIAG|nr:MULTISPECIES: hypothetical protein [Reichenbachiella]RJE72945.1 hypothetical protein BGP76_03075 [Reichenbachiella sp. MSK19-1]SHK14869.1 hypothetical protein SAMN04488028_103160 [Reichenbachiella agariperforans]